ncbi:thioredoxin family protein [Microbacterium soli]|uniref:Thioredoxin family protein n=1 Tax=Microbacterium soli TaxID=446075 RepID=A0ABP7MP57_9MICO
MPLTSALLVVMALSVLAVVLGVIWRARDGRRRSGVDTPSADLAELGATAGRVALVQFSTDTCARCPQVRRMLQGIAADHPGVDHVDVDLTHRPDLARRHRVLSTPTVFLVDSRTTVAARFVGAPRRADVEAALTELSVLQEAS